MIKHAQLSSLVERSGELSRQAERKAARLEGEGDEAGALKAKVIRSLNSFRVFSLAARLLNDGTHPHKFQEATFQAKRAWDEYQTAVRALDELGIRVKPVKRAQFQ